MLYFHFEADIDRESKCIDIATEHVIVSLFFIVKGTIELLCIKNYVYQVKRCRMEFLGMQRLAVFP